MNATIYANYGVLASEYRTVYTVDAPHCHASVSEQLTIEIPDTFEPGRNALGEILLTVPGISQPCLLSELLDTTAGDAPCLRWFDDSYRSHTVALAAVDSSDG